jgi:hypothetical protein
MATSLYHSARMRAAGLLASVLALRSLGFFLPLVVRVTVGDLWELTSQRGDVGHPPANDPQG